MLIPAIKVERPLAVIATSVFAAHLVVICFFCSQGLFAPVVSRPQYRPVHVQSIELRTGGGTTARSAPAIASAEPRQQPKKTSPIEKKKPAPEAKPKPTKKIETEPAAAEAPKKTPKIAADKIAQARANLKKISHDPVSTTNHEPSHSTALPSLSELDMAQTASGPYGKVEQSYEEILAARLKMLLTLPDYGDVKVKLTLERNGGVVSATVLRSESADNRAYVENILPTLRLPPFGKNFGVEPQHTFQIVLSNDS